jgi:hypothetical protein
MDCNIDRHWVSSGNDTVPTQAQGKQDYSGASDKNPYWNQGVHFVIPQNARYMFLLYVSMYFTA